LGGQVAAIGFAVLIPLVNTEVLPHTRLLIDVLPLPPRSSTHQAAHAPTRQTKVVPFQMTGAVLVAPRKFPDRATILSDPEDLPPEVDTAGVEGGLPGSLGSGSAVIDCLLRGASVAAPAPPTAPAKEVVKPVKRIVVGGNVQIGKLISGPRPEYPAIARQAGISGVVRLQAVISREGTVMNLRAVGGHPFLIQAAMEAAKHWIFRPTSLNGDPVEVATDIEVTFVLQR
jgi:protein TonB